jgi:Zn-dependent protease
MAPDIVDALAFFIVFLLSTTLHEAAHAWAAKLGGDLTAYHGGQVSLDPTPHIRRSPFGMVVLPLLTALTTGWPIGFASAPYDPQWAMRHPKRAALMALAGPAANLLLAVLAAVVIRVGYSAGWFHAPERISFGHVAGTELGGAWPGFALMLGVFYCENVLLCAFNLLPLPPLDGSGALPLVMRPETSRSYQQFIWSNPMLGFLGMFLAWKLFAVIFPTIFIGAVNLLYPGVPYG